MSQFLDSDGYINVAEFIALARDIDRMAAKEGLKPAEVYFSKKAVVKFDHPSKAKIDAEAFTKKRAQPIKMRTRMPASGSRVRMMVLLRNYKGLDQYADFWGDYQHAVKAIERHTAKAEKVIERLKSDAAKKRDTMNAAFDKNIKCLVEEVLPEDMEYAIGTSMMGKTVIIKLPNGGYMSVGKADKERFLKAQESENAPAPAKKPAAKPARGAKPAARTERAAKPAAKPARAERAAKPVAKAGTRSAAMKPALKQKPVAKPARGARPFKRG